MKPAQNPHPNPADGPAGLRIRLLGPMAVSRDGVPVAVASRKARALLGYLALRPGTGIARTVLTGLLWGERSEAQARASLRQALADLRAALAGAAPLPIVATRESVAWVPGAAWVDAGEVEARAASADSAALEAAADLVGGELMEGLAIAEAGFEHWLAGERERFRRLGAGIHARLMQLAEDGGRTDEAVAHGLALLALDPAREGVHRALMRLYAAQGRHDAALAQYQRCRSALAAQLDVRPDPETEDLARAIRAARRAGPPRPAAAPAPQAAASLAPTDRPSIAVLPFTNLSGDPEQAYFSDGITEDIITELSRYHSLRVIARNSCFQFRGDVDIGTVRDALGVRYVVEGSVRKAGSRVRVTSQLIDALTNTQVWAERYDRETLDIFAVQDDVARSVVATLEGRIAARDAEHARRKPTADWAAYDYLLRGRECSYRYQQVEAEPYYARAIELDPGYAQAHAWRAIALGVKYLHDERAETLDAAFASARQALALDDNDARCHHAMAYVALRRREYDLAGHHHERAVALNPYDADLAGQRANWLMHVGRLDEALATLDSSIERDPYPATWYWDVRGYVLYHLRRYDEAILAFRNVRAEPFWIAGMLAAAYGQAGQTEEAGRELGRYRALRPGVTLRTVADKILYADMRLHEHWLEGLRKAGLPT